MRYFWAVFWLAFSLMPIPCGVYFFRRGVFEQEWSVFIGVFAGFLMIFLGVISFFSMVCLLWQLHLDIQDKTIARAKKLPGGEHLKTYAQRAQEKWQIQNKIEEEKAAAKLKAKAQRYIQKHGGK